MAATLAPAGDFRLMADSMIELVVLGIPAKRTEIHSWQRVGEMRRRAPGLPPGHGRPVLKRPWQKRHLGGLWHRSMLPDPVDGVHATWLSMSERRRATLTAWNGRRIRDGAA